jgi:hypothetical protein
MLWLLAEYSAQIPSIEETIMAVSDEPKYVELGRSFQAKGGVLANDYTGRIIASADTFYLVIYMTPQELTGAYSGGGLIGGLLAAAATHGESIKRQVVKHSELPKEITGHPDWPISGSKDYTVVVIPKSQVKRIRYSWWKTFDIITPEQTYYVGTRMFGRSRVLNRLREWGWEF